MANEIFGFIGCGNMGGALATAVSRIVGGEHILLANRTPEKAAALAGAQVGIFAVSTYNTDYILVKSENFDRALAALAGAGYTVV
jgi:pyrroline-5-carboxylate reductase